MKIGLYSAALPQPVFGTALIIYVHDYTSVSILIQLFALAKLYA